MEPPIVQSAVRALGLSEWLEASLSTQGDCRQCSVAVYRCRKPRGCKLHLSSSSLTHKTGNTVCIFYCHKSGRGRYFLFTVGFCWHNIEGLYREMQFGPEADVAAVALTRRP